ncbi:long-chain-fatty-acid--CoA ligase [Exilibacterium tricleocarpae]|uniref:Long-chain-fatty-acid--CoA ligase n=1 Tax=Exilibacterium tricleocarpae TaxID=2591008 RepID=A0A545T8E0_9GAMM|nr:long-chain-fatty-acid--CoA ligase [Exilibacterium tricleocarpae]TQV73455.1 long-chain-fatty-acid--CoA ligase [Exilibacterium tricleocarpae]
MNGLMMDVPATITSIMQFAERVHPTGEVVSVTADNPRHRYTYAEAFRRTRKLANALQTYDLARGDRIATLAWNDYRHFELYYAVSCAGMVCHTINPRLFAEQIDYIVNHAEDQLLFIDPMFVPLVESLQSKLTSVKAYIVLADAAHMPDTTLPGAVSYEALIEPHSDTYDWPVLEETTASALCYTSGTTGNPKGVLYNHRATVLHAYASSMPDAFGIGRNDVVLPIVPMFHVNAWGVPYSAVMAGTKLVFPGPKMGDGATLARLINEEGVNISAGVPTVWLALLNYLNESGERVDCLDRIVVGGAACPLSIMEQFEDRYGVYTHAAWGMTEMSPLGTFNSRLDRKALGEQEYARLRLKAGRPIYGVEMKIVDDANKPLPWDGVAFGALKVRGPWICSEYFKLENSEAHDDEGWFDTGDVATIDPDGNMQITDRSKDVIKSGGEWISSIDLENTAVGHPAVEEAAVIGVYHPKWTERPLLVVVKKDGADLTREDMLAWFDGKVASWWVPNDVVFVDSLPHTATGKLSKKDIRQQLADYSFPEGTRE